MDRIFAYVLYLTSDQTMAFSAAYQAVSPFRGHSRLVHYTGYGAGIGIWLFTYWSVGSLLPWFGWPTATLCATVAAVACGTLMGSLFTASIGSPVGNVLLPAIMQVLVPFPFYRVPFSGVTWEPSLGLSLLAVNLLGMFAGPIAAMAVISRRYERMDVPRQWEAAVMPHSVRFFSDENWRSELTDQVDPDDVMDPLEELIGTYTDGRPPIDPRIEDYPDLEFHPAGALIGIVIAAPIVAGALYVEVTYFGTDSSFGGIMALAMLFMMVQSVKLERAVSPSPEPTRSD